MSGIGENGLLLALLALRLVGGHWLGGMHVGKDTSVTCLPTSHKEMASEVARCLAVFLLAWPQRWCLRGREGLGRDYHSIGFLHDRL